MNQDEYHDSDLWNEIDELREKRADLRKRLEIVKLLRDELFGNQYPFF